MKRHREAFFAVLIALLATAALTLAVQAQSPLTFQSPVPPQNESIVASSPQGHITITLSPGTDKASVTPTLAFNVPPTMPARLKMIGSVFAVEARSRSAAKQSITIRIDYTLPAEIAEDRLTIAFYDAAAEKWLPLPTTVDTTNHAATTTTDQAGAFALVEMPNAASLPSNAVIVDDLDAGFARYGNPAGWRSVSGSSSYYYLGHMYWTSNTYSVLDNYAVWTPALNSGPYQVYAFIDWDNATTQKARYQVVHNGQTTVYTVNQNIYYAEWVSLGTYQFGSTPGSNYVRLEDVTGETYLSKRIGFDAIGFVPNKVYLPAILKNYPPIKTKSGMHLGNRSADWPTSVFNLLDGTQSNGAFPAVVVVKSDQLYTIWRGGGICEVGGIDPAPRAPNLFAYLKKASAAGTKVIIRINPSPGNFTDWNDPVQPNHHLQSSNTPAGGTYCELSPGSGDWGFMHYRTAQDIAKEIEQIHNLNKNNGWQEYAFEPANEPNREWYTATPGSQTFPTIDEPVAWQEMDAYFSALYDAVKALTTGSEIRLLTPPMAQTRYAEGVYLNCDPQRLKNNSTGYDMMQTTYTTKNDGLSWHSYWTYGHESILSYCAGGIGQHVSTLLPNWMIEQIVYGTKLGFITEADLASPGQQMGNTLTNKDANTAATRSSIRAFFESEPSGIYPVMWLLNNNFVDQPGQNENAEINWHQAYTPTMGLTARPWFTTWWTQTDP
jgi:hypothetical protein